MSKIKLTNGWTNLPEGQVVLKIIDTEYKEQFGKLNILCVNQSGLKHTEKFSLLGKSGEPNNGAYAAFSILAKAALGDNNVDEIDPDDLKGKFFKCTVEHDVQPSNRNDGTDVTFVHLIDKEYAECFENGTTDHKGQAPKEATAPKKSVLDILTK